MSEESPRMEEVFPSWADKAAPEWIHRAKQAARRRLPVKEKSRCCALAIFLLIGLRTLAQSAPPMSREVERRVESILSQMTLDEKIDMIGGVDDFFIRGMPRLNLPRFKMADGPLGVRNYGPATTMAGGIALAATWNPVLAERVGIEIGRDARSKGVHFLLGPGVNMYRAPMNGRNFEYFGEDPFLASRIAVAYIKGVQSQGVSATIKHFMGNNSEFDRRNTDSVIDERTMREIYLPVFEAAVKEAHVGAVMDSYNLTNGTYMTQNTFLNSDVLKKEWGFDGVLMSDWGATQDGVAAANAGLDLEMPSGRFMNRQTLLPAIQEGKVSVATIDDKIRRILRKAVQFGWLERDQTDLSIPRYNQEGRQVALEAARESMVLLKNKGNLLPLSKAQIKSIAIIGPDAYPPVPVGGGSARVQPFAAVSFLDGISNSLGTAARTYYNRGQPSLSEMAAATNFSTAAANGQPGLLAEYFTNPELQGSPAVTRTELRIDFGGPAESLGGGLSPSTGSAAGLPHQWSAVRWTGYYIAQIAGAYDILVEAPGEDSRYRLYMDDRPLLDSWQHPTALVSYTTVSLEEAPHKIVLEHSRPRGRGAPRLRLGIVRRDALVDPQAKALAVKSDAVVLAVGFDPESESEGGDRTFLLPPGQEQLIQEIAAANRNTIVVVTSGGAVDMSSWLDRVPAVLQAWYPGQEGGTALAEVLLGAISPSGRLPVTFESHWADNPTHDSYYPESDGKRIVYREGVFVGYRGYQRSGAKALFPFGFGLCYTTFRYRNLSIGPVTPPGRFGVSFDVTNTGKRAGAEVGQVYLADMHAKVSRPAKELKGFAKVVLSPGETRRVTVTLDNRAFSYYDVGSKQWRAEPGDYEVLVGRSVEQIELQGKVTLREPAVVAARGKR
ncbi:MAG TPA: glycoside hydrolase family 3 C-terminal domain-containing protein [Candidatus Acidoferrales bacterium]|nr:glycoside hydrolase family 3 C-terminal domain-containing protein [Candidatus Acidoferrales bacterium]